MSLLRNGNVIGGISKTLLSKIGFSDLNTKSQNLCDAINELVDMIYPVGSIYMSVNDINPSTLFGGTWEAWGNGRVPVGVDANDTAFDTVEETGGSASESYTPAGTNSGGTVNSHKLTAAESGVPAHSHTMDHTHSMTQPAFTVTGGAVTNGITGGSHSHTSKGWAKVTDGSGSYVTLGGAGKSTDYSTNAATHTHNLPSHSHTVTRSTNAAVTKFTGSTSNNTATAASSGHSHGFTDPTFSGTISHLQPYITCYMWKRVA